MKYWKLVILFLTLIKFIRGNEYLLPKVVTPIFYNLKIVTTLNEGGPNDFTFYGVEHIDVICDNAANIITLHSCDLSIDKIEVKNLKSSSSVRVLQYELEPKYDFLHIYLNDQLEKGEQYRIAIRFDGNITNGLAGYYLSSYHDKETKNKKYLALTQFEATSARLAFPCFDEPSYKAKFKISVGHRNDLVAMSNMPLEKTMLMQNLENYVLDTFQESVPMSTYLVAYMVSDFVYETSPADLGNTTFRIWARKSALSQVHFATTVGPSALSFYENFFNIPFPLPKQDMVAIPDFSSGAMENWGLITYRETSLLYDPKVATRKNEQRVVSVICHELAHQWFGNLVTMKWWNDLWLNEGFATYMSILCVDYLFPDWQYDEHHTVKESDVVYLVDSLEASQPLSNPVKNPAEIQQLFGAIAYKKGATIIKMMEKSLGKDVLQNGVSNYLYMYAYRNAEQDNLWNALTTTAHESEAIPSELTVKEIMDTWTLQTGYPVIYVERNYETGEVIITQKRFLQKGESEDEPCWWIPLSSTTSDKKEFSETKPKIWMSCPLQSEVFKYNEPKNWIIFNIQRAGLYRVCYDEKNWQLIIDYLLNNPLDDIHVLNRRALIDDIMSFAEIGEVSYDLAFRLLHYLKQEENRLPWEVAFAKLRHIALILQRTSSYEVLQKYMVYILQPLYEKFGGFDTKSNDEVEFQNIINRKACYYGVEDCRNDVKELFTAYINNPENNTIHKDSRQTVYCNGLRMSGEEEWNFFWNKYLDSNVGTEKIMYIKVLGCTKNKKILEKFIHFSIEENSGIRKQDAYSVFDSVVDNKDGYEVAREFLYQNGPAVLEVLSPNRKKISQYFTAIAASITQQDDIDMFMDFIQRNPDFKIYSKIGIEQATERIGLNVNWYQKYFKELVDTLNDQINK